jgi:hypothetical protein
MALANLNITLGVEGVSKVVDSIAGVSNNFVKLGDVSDAVQHKLYELEKTIQEDGGNALRLFSSGVDELSSKLHLGFLGVISSVTNTINRVGLALRDTIKGVVGMKGALVGLASGASLTKVATDLLGVSITGLWTSLSPILPILLAIAAILLTIKTAWDMNLGGIQDLIFGAIEPLVDAFWEFFDTITETLENIFSFIGGILEVVSKFVLFKLTIDIVVFVFKLLLLAIKGVGEVFEFIGGNIDNFIEAVKRLLDVLWPLKLIVQGILSIFDALSGIFEKATETVDNLISGSGVTELIEKLGILKPVVEALFAPFNILSRLVEGVKTGLDALGNLVGNILGPSTPTTPPPSETATPVVGGVTPSPPALGEKSNVINFNPNINIYVSGAGATTENFKEAGNVLARQLAEEFRRLI